MDIETLANSCQEVQVLTSEECLITMDARFSKSSHNNQPFVGLEPSIFWLLKSDDSADLMPRLRPLAHPYILLFRLPSNLVYSQFWSFSCLFIYCSVYNMKAILFRIIFAFCHIILLLQAVAIAAFIRELKWDAVFCLYSAGSYGEPLMEEFEKVGSIIENHILLGAGWDSRGVRAVA